MKDQFLVPYTNDNNEHYFIQIDQNEKEIGRISKSDYTNNVYNEAKTIVDSSIQTLRNKNVPNIDDLIETYRSKEIVFLQSALNVLIKDPFYRINIETDFDITEGYFSKNLYKGGNEIYKGFTLYEILMNYLAGSYGKSKMELEAFLEEITDKTFYSKGVNNFRDNFELVARQFLKDTLSSFSFVITERSVKSYLRGLKKNVRDGISSLIEVKLGYKLKDKELDVIMSEVNRIIHQSYGVNTSKKEEEAFQDFIKNAVEDSSIISVIGEEQAEQQLLNFLRKLKTKYFKVEDSKGAANSDKVQHTIKAILEKSTKDLNTYSSVGNAIDEGKSFIDITLTVSQPEGNRTFTYQLDKNTSLINYNNFKKKEVIIKDLNDKQIDQICEIIITWISNQDQNKFKKQSTGNLKPSVLFKNFMESNLQSEEARNFFKALWKTNGNDSSIESEIDNMMNKYLKNRMLPVLNIFGNGLVLNKDQDSFTLREDFLNTVDIDDFLNKLSQLYYNRMNFSGQLESIEYKDIKINKSDLANAKTYQEKMNKIKDKLNEKVDKNWIEKNGASLINDYFKKFYGSIGEICFTILFKNLVSKLEINNGSFGGLMGNSRNEKGEEAHADIRLNSTVGMQSKQLLSEGKYSPIADLKDIYSEEYMQLGQDNGTLFRYIKDLGSPSNLNNLLNAMRQVAFFNLDPQKIYSENRLSPEWLNYLYPALVRIIDRNNKEMKGVHNLFYIGNGMLMPISELLYNQKGKYYKKTVGIFDLNGELNKQNIKDGNYLSILSKNNYVVPKLTLKI